jgi:hypothetical protein
MPNRPSMQPSQTNYWATEISTPSVADTDSVFESFVATPIPRHNGHAFRPETNHYPSNIFIKGVNYLIDTFFME